MLATPTTLPEPVLDLRDLLNTYLEPEKVAIVLRAFEIGDKAHQGQTRKTGEPYILHPIAVARILANMRMDYSSVAAAILQQSIGSSGDNRQAFYQMFDGWAEELEKNHPEATEAALRRFRSNMYDGDFVFNVSRDFVRECQIPMLVLLGNDLYHPSETSREIARLAPDAELVERWKEPEVVVDAVRRVREFLQRHSG